MFEVVSALLAGVPRDWLLACLCVGVLQLAVVLRFRRGLRLAASRRAVWPSVSVIVPCKGAAPGLAERLEALLAQDYPGDIESFLVVPRAEDPAYAAALRAADGLRGAGTRVLVSDARPMRCSEKVLNILVAAEQARGEVLIFADSDLLVRRDWCRLLVEGLDVPRTAVAFSSMLYIPRGWELGSWLRIAWTAWGIPWLEPMVSLSGQSMAMARCDFDALKVREAWMNTVSEDLTLARLCRRAGRKTRFVGGAMPSAPSSGGLAEALSLFNRWMTIIRVYEPRIWWVGLLCVVLKWGVVVRAAQSARALPLLGLVLGLDAIFLALVLGGIKRHVAEVLNQAPPWLRRLPCLSGLLVPLLWLGLVVNYLCSWLAPAIAWSGWSYTLRHSEDAQARPGEDESRTVFWGNVWRLSGAVLGGVALGSAFRPGAFGLLAWLGFVPLFWVLAGESDAWGALRKGWAFGTAATMAGVPWLLEALRRFTGLPQPDAFFVFATLCAYHGLQFGLVGAAARVLAERLRLRRVYGVALAFVPLMVLAEGLFPTAFPGQLANSQVFHLPTVQLVSVLGLAGVAWLVLAVNAALSCALAGRGGLRWIALAVCAAAVVFNEAWGRRAMAQADRQAAAGRSLHVGIVQGCLPPGYSSQNLRLHDRLTAQAAAAGALDLVVWPESTLAGEVAYGSGPVELGGRPLSEVLGREVRTRAPILFSALGRDGSGAAHNISLLTGPGREFWGLSEKLSLVPFGEYVPGGRWLAWVRRLSPRTGSLSPGRPRLLELPGQARFGVTVCYEDLQPELARSLTGLGAQFLVNQTNDAWFGGMALEQHLRSSVLRAIENRRYLLRAANTGVSAVVDPAGRIIGRMDKDRVGSLTRTIAALDAETPQAMAARWSTLAGIPALLLLCLVARRRP